MPSTAVEIVAGFGLMSSDCSVDDDTTAPVVVTANVPLPAANGEPGAGVSVPVVWLIASATTAPGLPDVFA